jgi:hypothetical protein
MTVRASGSAPGTRSLRSIRRAESAALDRRRRACGHVLRRPVLFQLAEDRIQKIDQTGRVLATIGARRRRDGPDVGGRDALGGTVRDRKIHQVDPDTGAILRTIESNTSSPVSRGWTESWHATWEGDSLPRRSQTGGPGEHRHAARRRCLRARVDGDQFFTGGGRSGKVRAVRRPKRAR